MSVEKINIANNPELEKNNWRKIWEEKGLEKELEAKMKEAKSLTAIGSGLFELGRKVKEGMVFGMAEGEFQIANWQKIKPLIEQWKGYDGEGDKKSLEKYRGASALIEEFPGDCTRRAVDRVLRDYLGIKN